MTQTILPALFLLGGIGITVGVLLALASKVFYVYVDPKILAVEEALPGANCGGCGLPGCSANAESIVAGRTAPNSCVAAGADTAQAIAAILGVSVEAKEPDIAQPGCYFGNAQADLKYHYDGLGDCRAAALLGGGAKVCRIGCIGLGTCARACPFGAIQMGPQGLPVVDEVRCTGCGTCERVCPKTIINLSSVTRRILKEYLSDECTTPCQRACPAGINIREYVRRAAEGDYLGAVQVIKERNPFPTVIGRICPRPCEDDCRRQLVDEPVAINYLKRFVADYEKARGERVQPFKAPETGRKLAVVGGGVEGLATAFFAARLGHAPVVYEATDRLGGLLRSAIASYRLPHDILDWDIEGILEMGVEARLNQAMGTDFDIAELLSEGYAAVFLASGGWDSRLARGEVERIEEFVPGTHLLIDFIRAGRRPSPPPFKVHRDVVIVGGGNLAAEAAAIAKRMGAATVTLALREDEAATALQAEALESLAASGVKIVCRVAVTRFTGEGGRLTRVELTDLDTGVTTRLPATNLILAAGRYPELIFVPAPVEAPEGEAAAEAPTRDNLAWEAVLPYKKPEFSGAAGLFAEGDVITDFSGAIKAIGAGRRAAASIHQIMYGITVGLNPKVITPDCVIQNVYAAECVAGAPRHIMPLAPPQAIAVRGELELGFDEAAARAEASRCLQCGLICYQRTAPATEAVSARA